jgi:predicted Mrr-cat superfamily restriction endonuclease
MVVFLASNVRGIIVNEIATTPPTTPSAYVLRITLGNINGMQVALDSDTIIIGWSKAAALLNAKLDWEQFRKVLIDSYPIGNNLRSAGNAAGNMWRFIREMKRGDYVVVPHGTGFFYVAQIEGDAHHLPEKVEEDTAFRRKVRWLNGKKPIARDKARSALYSRMKIRGVSAYAYDLVDEIRSVVDDAESGRETDFAQQLTERMAQITLEQMRQGLMNERKFEKLVAVVLRKLGATTAITPRPQDKGDDIVASFKDIGVTVVAQVKYHINANAFPESRRGRLVQYLHAATSSAGDFDTVEAWASFGSSETYSPDLPRR